MSKVDDWDDVDSMPDWTGTSSFVQARDEVKSVVDRDKEITVGKLSRDLPHYQRILFDVLESLSVTGDVRYESCRPMPTRVYSTLEV